MTHDPAASASAAPLASTSATPAIDAGCKTAKEDANERLAKFCEDSESNCGRFTDPSHPDVGAGHAAPDLDGDGVPEISWGWGSGGVNTETYLYRGGPGCALLLLAPGGNGTVKALAARHGGWSDISVEDTSHCEGACKCTPDISVYTFRDAGYEPDEKRHVKGTWAPCGSP